jgi:hypothetical protein
LPIERSHLLHQLDTERRTLARIGETLEQDEHITRLTSSDGSHHTIIFSSLDSENADAIIVRETAHYRGLLAPSNFPAKMEVEWKLYEHDAPADLINKLETAGFEIGACESVVALDLSDHHDWIDDPLANHVERVTTLEQVNLYRQTAELIFHKNYAYTANELSRGIATGSTEHIGYLAFDSTMEGCTLTQTACSAVSTAARRCRPIADSASTGRSPPLGRAMLVGSAQNS